MFWNIICKIIDECYFFLRGWNEPEYVPREEYAPICREITSKISGDYKQNTFIIEQNNDRMRADRALKVAQEALEHLNKRL